MHAESWWIAFFWFIHSHTRLLSYVNYQLLLSFSTLICLFLRVVAFVFLHFLSNAWLRPIWCTCRPLPRSYQSLGVFIYQETSPCHCLPEEMRARKKVTRFPLQNKYLFPSCFQKYIHRKRKLFQASHTGPRRLSRSLTFSSHPSLQFVRLGSRLQIREDL